MLKGDEMPQKGQVQGAMTKSLLEKKEQYVARGISNLAPIFVQNAKGAVIQDLDGNTYIDFYGGIGVVNAGHCPEGVVNAIKEQAENLLHSCFMVGMYEPYVNLAEKLVYITPGDHPKKAMLVNSGAEAVENAVKIARAHTHRPGIIAFEAGFHGRTLLTMTLTSKVKPYKHEFGPFAPEVYKVPSAYCYRCIYRSTYPECGMHCLEYFERFFVSEADPSNIAAMIIEPVQGEGGFIVPPMEFLPGLKSICEKHGIVFIADEVQTGFARTGKMFAVEHFGVVPDLMTLAKGIASGMPLSAVVGKAEIMDSPTPGRIGGTYGGNPLSCVAALATIDLIEKENLPVRAEKIGSVIVARIKALQQKYHQIGDIRSLGAMVGIELVKDIQTRAPHKEATTAIIHECFNRGLLTMGAGIFSNVVRFLPPLVITDQQLDTAIAIFEESLAAVLGK
ncbi:MAG: 4-aminobutyrate--2-oxoglutarate transaminase [bacterium]|nr:4-aminobutyrate--2-oxoglutarate transaminase [bacterium]